MKALLCVFLALVLMVLTTTDNGASRTGVQLSSPANGAIVPSSSVTLTWGASEPAGGIFHVQVSRDASFEGRSFRDAIIDEPQLSIGGLENGVTYYWHVGLWKVLMTDSWSEVRSFTCRMPVPQVKLISPANGSTVSTCTAPLAWEKFFLATQYLVQVSTDNRFASCFYNASNGTATLAPISGSVNGTTYFWRVGAKWGDAAVTWSPTWSYLYKISPPNPPSLVSPPDGATLNQCTATLTWATVQGASEYWVQASRNAEFTSVILDAQGVKSTQSSVSISPPGTWCSWRVKAKKECGNWGGWSSTRRFSCSPNISPPGTGTVKPF